MIVFYRHRYWLKNCHRVHTKYNCIVGANGRIIKKDYNEYNTTYSSYNVFTGEDSSTKTTAGNVHLMINLSQLCFTITMFLLFFMYFSD